MEQPAGRPWGGVSAEDRIAIRREKLIATAIELLSTGGLAATTVREVADRAGVSRRFFYESFTDLDALLRAIFEDTLATVLNAVLEAIQDSDRIAEDMTRSAISAFITEVERNPAVFRAVFVEAPANPTIRTLLDEARQSVEALIKAQAVELYGLTENDETRLDFAVRMVVAGSIDTVAAWVTGRLSIEPEQLIELFTQHYVVVTESLTT